MAPLSNDVGKPEHENEEESPEDVVISGMSGRLPESVNISKFKENLYNKVDMVTEGGRWKVAHPEIPQRTGKISGLNKFDTMFFAIHYKQADAVDPMSRILLELAYEAIVDAGVNPISLRGTNTGCFIGSWYSESDKVWFFEKIQLHGSGITGCSRAMLCNRISYWLGINGPSIAIDTSCSSGLYALDQGLHAIRSGQCDAAVVGGANLTLHPAMSLNFSRLGRLAPDGKTKAFDQAADGYSRSDGIAVIFLQKAKDAKRIYATVVHSKTNNDGYKEDGISVPCAHLQERLIHGVYEECGISPQSVTFVEANGIGTQTGDEVELQVLDKVLCEERKEPLLVGSVKTNMGHAESASSLASIIKVALAMETGSIAPNLHFSQPRSDIAALTEGRIKVVSELTPWRGKFAGISAFGIGGANAHAVLRANSRSKPATDPALEDGLPRLIVASGRTHEAVETILSELERQPVDSEHVALLHSIHAEAIPHHIYRGFTLLHANSKPTSPKLRAIQHFPGAKRPVWFVFAGMGSQWAGMGKDLMRLPVFTRAIERCDVVLRPKGLDIRHIITHEDPSIFDNILNSFVGIAAVQIGLVDVLTAAGIVPDGIVGHSVGELGCAYADGCFTAEQMVLSAYSRGLASIETPLIHGSMAAVGLSHDVTAPLCPADVEVACHNGTDSCTISGPAESVTKFVAQLKEKQIFAREVACSNIAYHSRYIAKAGPKLLRYLKQVITDPKRRSDKWVSSSVPELRWGEAETQFSSAEYHTNNLLCPVLFAEAIRHVPSDAIAIEIAPHALLQAILRGSLDSTCTNVPLTKRGSSNGLDLLFSAIGKLYLDGIQPQLLNIHPRVQFPVSRGTPMISPLVKWQHDDDWFVVNFSDDGELKRGEHKISIKTRKEKYRFYNDHVIDGRLVFPATGVLVMMWKIFASMNTLSYLNCPVVLENIKFLRTIYIPNTGQIDLQVKVTQGTGTFEVVEGGSAVVTGRIYIPEDIDKEMLDLPPPKVEITPLTPPPLSTRDVYEELRLRGYNYNGIFKSIRELDSTGVIGKLHWHNNYVAFMDALLQLEILQLDSRLLYVPTALQRLVIHPHRHRELMESLGEKADFPAFVHRRHTMVHAGGIELRGLQASELTRRKTTTEPVLEAHQLLEYRPSEPVEYKTALRACAQIVLENINTSKPKVIEWVSIGQQAVLATKLRPILDHTSARNTEILLANAGTVLTETEAEAGLNSGVLVSDIKLSSETAAHLVLCGDGSSLLALPTLLSDAVVAVSPGGFLLLQVRRGVERSAEQTLEGLGAVVVAVMPCSSEDPAVLLLARKVDLSKGHVSVVHVTEVDDLNFKWVTKVQEALNSDPPSHRLYLVAQNLPKSGLLGLVKCLVKEGNVDKIRCVFIQSDHLPTFCPQEPAYASQLRGDLLQNVFSHDNWGSYRHVLLRKQNKEVSHACVNMMTRGDLSSFRWLQGPIKNTKDAVQGVNHLYHVFFSALNFRDVMTATGKLAVEVVAKNRLRQDCVQGLEFSGRAPNGRRVMGLVTCGAISNFVLADPNLVWDVPATWSLEEAATVPLAYSTVYYALVIKARIERGKSILIHSATGGIGQAAINIALHLGCTIFVTVGTAEKRDFLLKNYPQIAYENIGNSRDTSFEQLIQDRTAGTGVDIVFNSLVGDKLHASWRCAADHGKIVELGNIDMINNTQIGYRYLIRYISIHAVMLDSILHGSEHDRREIKELISMGIRTGIVKPLVRTVFDKNNVVDAFRFLASGDCIGKTVIKIREEELDSRGKFTSTQQPSLLTLQAWPKFYCNPDKTYVIINGLDNFGLEIADWLVIRGARKVAFNCNSKVTSGYQTWRIQHWQKHGAEIQVITADLSHHGGCESMLKSVLSKLGSVAAIFNCDLKANVAVNIDRAARQICLEFEHFIMFATDLSSIGDVITAVKICERRREEGLAALVINCGHIKQLQEEHMTETVEGQDIFTFLTSLDTFLTLPRDLSILVSSSTSQKKLNKATIIRNIAPLLGTREAKCVPVDSTLLELGVKDCAQVNTVKEKLDRDYEMFHSTQDIQNLTLSKLCELVLSAKEQAIVTEEQSHQESLEIISWQEICSQL